MTNLRVPMRLLASRAPSSCRNYNYNNSYITRVRPASSSSPSPSPLIARRNAFPLPAHPARTTVNMSLFRSLSSASAPKIITDSKEKTQKIIDDNNVVVFSKTWCSYSSQTKSILSSLDADFLIVELDRESDGGDLQEALETISGQRTVPNVYINQKHIGGNSDVQALASSKKLQGLLKEAGAIKA